MPTTEAHDKIDVHQAVRIAKGKFANAFAGEFSGDIRLEEVDRSEDGSHWLITLGYYTPKKGLAAAMEDMQRAQFGIKARAGREFKVVWVNANTGDVTRIKIREGLAV